MKEQTSPDLPHSKLWCEKKKKAKLLSLTNCYLGFYCFQLKIIKAYTRHYNRSIQPWLHRGDTRPNLGD